MPPTRPAAALPAFHSAGTARHHLRQHHPAWHGRVDQEERWTINHPCRKTNSRSGGSCWEEGAPRATAPQRPTAFAASQVVSARPPSAASDFSARADSPNRLLQAGATHAGRHVTDVSHRVDRCAGVLGAHSNAKWVFFSLQSQANVSFPAPAAGLRTAGHSASSSSAKHSSHVRRARSIARTRGPDQRLDGRPDQ